MGTKQYDSATDLLTFSRASGGTALRKISYGNELVTNGTFDSDLSGWVASHGASTQEFDNGTIKVQHTGYNGNSRQYLTGLVVGTSYQVNFSVTNDTQGGGGASFVGIWETNSQGSDIETFTYTRGVVGSYTFTFTATSTASQIRLYKGSNTGVTNFDNISIKEVLFDQADGTLQVFNHGNNKPRIEYDATGAVKGLLIEEARTNRIATSEVAPTNYFGGLTKSVDNSVVSPAGGNNVEKFTLSNANDYHYVGNHHDICTGTGTSTYSIFAKGSGHNLIRLRMSNVSGIPSCDFDLSTGQKQVTSSSDSSVTGAIESIGNGWWRCAITYAAVKSNPYASVFLIDAMDASSPPFQGDGTSSVYVWGSQYESGSFPTSYIPTTGAPATRASDIAEIPTSAFGYNNDKGSLVIDVLTPVADQVIPLAIFNTSTYNESRSFWKSNFALNAAGDYFIFNSHDGVTTQSSLGQQTQAEYTKLGLSYGDNEKAVRDGGTIINGNSRSTSPTRLLLGGRDDGHQSQCWIKSIQYYPRQLTNTQLQELTT